MAEQKRLALYAGGCALALFLLLNLVPSTHLHESSRAHAQPAELVPPTEEPRYVGLTKCAACHYKQYLDWKKSPHAKTFDNLPTKYKNDQECLQCHATKHAFLSGQVQNSPNLGGVGCESCHGPGSEHANLALTFVGQEEILTEDAVSLLQSKIQRTALDQCIKCHVTMSHKSHPKFDREVILEKRPSRQNSLKNGSFFKVH